MLDPFFSRIEGRRDFARHYFFKLRKQDMFVLSNAIYTTRQCPGGLVHMQKARYYPTVLLQHAISYC